MCQHFAFNLQGLIEDKFSLSSDSFNEFQCMQMGQESQFSPGIALYRTLKAQIFYLYENYTEALKTAKLTEEMLPFTIGLANESEHYFYHSLILANVIPQASPDENAEYYRKLAKNQEKMKIWADNCPENFTQILASCGRNCADCWERFRSDGSIRSGDCFSQRK